MHGRDGRGLWPQREAERREERRAQVLLQGGLQRLDEARTYHINTLAREQRRLHKDLLNIRAGNPWRRNLQPLGSRPLNPEPDHLAIPYRTALPKIPRAGRDPEKHRSARAQCGGAPRPQVALQARVHDFICSAADTPGAEGAAVAPLCLPDLKPQPGDGERASHAKPAEEPGREERSKGERRTDKQKEREGDRQKCVPPAPPPPSPIPPPPPPFESLAPVGRPRTLHLLPDFVQSLAEARKARYIRYRGRPPCETELSITEIFARGNTGSAHGS